MKKFHIALAVNNIDESIIDYSKRLECEPEIVIAGEYALWRTNILNFSIRQSNDVMNKVRHIGWEDPAATQFSKEKDVNGLLWEQFNAEQQQEEIRTIWPK